MVISNGKFTGTPLVAVPTEDLALVAFDARRAGNRDLLNAVLSESRRRRRRREQNCLFRRRQDRRAM
jgi:hypothetical protein